MDSIDSYAREVRGLLRVMGKAIHPQQVLRFEPKRCENIRFLNASPYRIPSLKCWEMSMTTSNDLALLTIEKLFSENSHYVIPIYQRNYAWGAAEIEQLIQDIADAVQNLKKPENNTRRNTIWAAW